MLISFIVHASLSGAVKCGKRGSLVVNKRRILSTADNRIETNCEVQVQQPRWPLIFITHPSSVHFKKS